MYQGCRLHFIIVRTALFTGKSNWLSNPRSEVCDLPFGPIILSDELWISGKKYQSKMDVYMYVYKSFLESWLHFVKFHVLEEV